jgi:putative sigma-54 modulation protein
MRIGTHGDGVPVKEELREYVRRAVFFAIGRFVPRILSVSVLISDVNGPRGGVDKRCKIRIDMGPLGTVMAEDTDSQVRAAIDRASERAGRGLRRVMQRRIDGRRIDRRGSPAEDICEPEGVGDGWVPTQARFGT